MQTPNRFEGDIRKSIEASISVKERLLRDSDLVTTVGKVAEILIDALGAGNKLLLLATAVALQTHSTSPLN
jgi:phosphoheptose isomerase